MINNFILTAAVSNGMGILKPLYLFFGKCMEGLLFVCGNKYFIALTIFTILTRLVLFPFNLRQQKSMAKTTRLQPKIQKIQKKYSNTNDPRDRQKMNEEMQALYAREGHNPMNMGCGTMMFQMIFLMGVIGIIYYPLQYILGIDAIADNANDIVAVLQKTFDIETGSRYYFQLDIIQNFAQYKDILASKFPKIFTAENIAAIESFKSHLTIFGIDMTQTPHWKDGIIVIFPILCLASSMGTSVMSTIIQKKTNPAAAAQTSQMMIMMLMMPFFSFWFSFQVPAAVAFYWIVSSLVAIVQQLVMTKFFPPKKNMARSMIEGTIERRSREESIKKTK